MNSPTGAIGELWWHVHHGNGWLFEPLYEPAENRRQFIRENKPLVEVETRLRLFRPVLGDLNPPEYCRKARAKWQEADAKWQEADAKMQEAYAKWQEADAKWQEADAKWREAYAKWKASPDWKRVEELHAKECPNCPWDGETIFPDEARK